MALPPPTRLGRYRVLSPACGLRVSPLQLGCMSLGNKTKPLGAISKEQAFQILDTYYDAGGNFLDTANAYHGGQSEEWIGEWLEGRGCREDIIIATKYTANTEHGMIEQHPIQVNRAGNSAKSMKLGIDNSLRRLRTDYVDVFYVHWWDWTTPVPEVMHALNRLVESGKVLYLGISDTPAWIVSKANEYARAHGLAQFVIYQGRWSPAARDIERDLVPMARSEGLAIAAWGALGQGRFQRRADRGTRADGRGVAALDEREAAVSDALEKVADDLGVENLTSVALAYVMAKYPWVYPIVGGRKVEHLIANIGALEIHLTEEQIQQLDAALPFEYGEPGAFFGLDPRVWGYQQNFHIESAGLVDFVPHAAPVDMTSVRESDAEAKAKNPVKLGI
ncbi:uncharacterized protein COLE_05259 [Cutaneotrichosporon oleaginosum]|uniref:uncharacterized protein n=1 Tax=Cutaneotrichosporon oleaginosum TaxID=879819 RepID=UPI0013245916|nr:hypothetical protein COLE_05259 [Cutaneotrichosporon oleaginosum]